MSEQHSISLVLPFAGHDADLSLGMSVLLAENLQIPGFHLGLAAVYQRGPDDAEGPPRSRPLAIHGDPDLVEALTPYLKLDGVAPDMIVTGELTPPEGELDGQLRLTLFDELGTRLHEVEGPLPSTAPVPALTALFSTLFDQGAELADTPPSTSWAQLSGLATAVAVIAIPEGAEPEQRLQRYQRSLALALDALGEREDPFLLALRKLVTLAGLPSRQRELDAQAAAQALLSALERLRPPPDLAASVSRTLLGLGHSGQARQVAQQAVDQHPHDRLAWRALIEATEAELGTSSALAMVLAQIETLRGNPELLNEVGRLLRRAGRHEEASAMWEEAASRRPEHWRAPTNLGLLARSRGETDEALRWFRLAVAHAENPRIPLRLLAEELLPQRREHSAELQRHLERLVELEPREAWAHLQLGMVLVMEGSIRDAAEHLELVSQLAPGSRWHAEADKELFAIAEPAAWKNVRRAYRLCAESEPLAGLTSMAATLDGPEVWIQQLGLAMASRRLDRLGDARDHLLALLERFPRHDGLLKEALGVLRELGETEAALELARRALTLFPRDAQVRSRLAQSLLQTGRIDEARNELAQLEQQIPDDPAVAELRVALARHRSPRRRSTTTEEPLELPAPPTPWWRRPVLWWRQLLAWLRARIPGGRT